MHAYATVTYVHIQCISAIFYLCVFIILCTLLATRNMIIFHIWLYKQSKADFFEWQVVCMQLTGRQKRGEYEYYTSALESSHFSPGSPYPQNSGKSLVLPVRSAAPEHRCDHLYWGPIDRTVRPNASFSSDLWCRSPGSAPTLSKKPTDPPYVWTFCRAGDCYANVRLDGSIILTRKLTVKTNRPVLRCVYTMCICRPPTLGDVRTLTFSFLTTTNLWETEGFSRFLHVWARFYVS